ncbi:MAG: hypothetical protein VW683_01345 [Betaproteobacteria bacterium]
MSEIKKIPVLYGINIMWYEHAIVEEHVNSILNSYEHSVKSELDLTIRIDANLQTYIEEPEDETTVGSFKEVIESSVERLREVAKVELNWYTQDHPFYGIADHRRDLVRSDGWVVWGETDCLLPHQFFRILTQLSQNLDTPTYCLTFSYRKMWDQTWNVVEHPLFKMTNYSSTHRDMVREPFNWHDYINQEQLDRFNGNFQNVDLVRLSPQKIDGSLLALWGVDPEDTPLIPSDMHFSREDFVAQLAMEVQGIPQYHVSTILKGHNYEHPMKRRGTSSNREQDVYKQYESESWAAGVRFINELAEKEGVDVNIK